MHYLRRNDGIVVSNDLFRDHTQKVARESSAFGKNVADMHAAAKRDWMNGHVMSYAFVGDEFMPNPSFRFG